MPWQNQQFAHWIRVSRDAGGRHLTGIKASAVRDLSASIRQNGPSLHPRAGRQLWISNNGLTETKKLKR